MRAYINNILPSLQIGFNWLNVFVLIEGVFALFWGLFYVLF